MLLAASDGARTNSELTLNELKEQPVFELADAVKTKNKESILRIRTSFVNTSALIELFPNLQGLELYGLGISTPEELKHCPYLRILDVSNNAELTDISSIAFINELQELSFSSTELINIPSDFSQLQNLQRFKMHLGKNLADIQVLETLPKLTYLELVDCNNIEKFPSRLPSLKHLKTSDIFVLVNIQTVLRQGENIDSLDYLDMNACPDIQAATQFIRGFKGLKKLNLSNNPQLKDVSNLKDMSVLEELNLSFCNSLEVIPESFSSLQNLKTINLSFNSALTDISGLAGLKNLKQVILPNADLIKTIPKKDQERFKKIALIVRNNLKRDGLVYY